MDVAEFTQVLKKMTPDVQDTAVQESFKEVSHMIRFYHSVSRMLARYSLYPAWVSPI